MGVLDGLQGARDVADAADGRAAGLADPLCQRVDGGEDLFGMLRRTAGDSRGSGWSPRCQWKFFVLR